MRPKFEGTSGTCHSFELIAMKGAPATVPAELFDVEAYSHDKRVAERAIGKESRANYSVEVNLI
jgi:hypothetical protein